MKLLVTAKEASRYSNRYALALYHMGSNPPRNGLVQKQYYVGQILDGGHFRVLKPNRMCSLSEFLNFKLVSRRWPELSRIERLLLFAIYSQGKLALDSLSTEIPATRWKRASSDLDAAGYLCRTDELGTVELTPVGEAEVQHQLFNLSAGDNLLQSNGGIRIRHHDDRNHEIDLGRASALSVNVDGMLIRIFTLPGSGTLTRVDYDRSQSIYMSRRSEDQRFAQVYIDRAAHTLNSPIDKPGEIAMKDKTIRITSLDQERLKKLLRDPDLLQQKPYLDELEQEIDRALIVEPSEVPGDTITMNSTARLIDLNTQEEMIFTLVYPDRANIAEGRISVLAPIGTAILGHNEGEVLESEVPDGILSLKVDRILYQPEAAGEYEL